MRLCYYTGARVESLCSIAPGDIDLAQRVVHLKRAKGDKPYVVPLSNEAAGVCRELLAMTLPGAWTVVGVKPRTFWLWVRQAGEVAGIHVTPHMLRHSFATHLLNQGVNVRVVQELLNHASLEMTQRYTAVTDPDKAEAVARLQGFDHSSLPR